MIELSFQNILILFLFYKCTAKCQSIRDGGVSTKTVTGMKDSEVFNKKLYYLWTVSLLVLLPQFMIRILPMSFPVLTPFATTRTKKFSFQNMTSESTFT